MTRSLWDSLERYSEGEPGQRATCLYIIGTPGNWQVHVEKTDLSTPGPRWTVTRGAKLPEVLLTALEGAEEWPEPAEDWSFI